MLKYMESKYGDRATRGDKSNLQAMKNEVARLEQLVKEQKLKGNVKKEKPEQVHSEDETDEEVSITQVNL
jgi:hypothetical protein